MTTELINAFKRTVELLVLHVAGPPIEDDPWWLKQVRWWSYPEYSFQKKRWRHLQENPPAPTPIRYRRVYYVRGRRGGWYCDTVYADSLLDHRFEVVKGRSKGEQVRMNVDGYLATFTGPPNFKP